MGGKAGSPQSPMSFKPIFGNWHWWGGWAIPCLDLVLAFFSANLFQTERKHVNTDFHKSGGKQTKNGVILLGPAKSEVKKTKQGHKRLASQVLVSN